MERLNEHTKKLAPLMVRDCVVVQNQVGNFPGKWDKTGMVVEKRNFDRYLVKLDGSGRCSLRNRKFLRKILPVCRILKDSKVLPHQLITEIDQSLIGMDTSSVQTPETISLLLNKPKVSSMTLRSVKPNLIQHPIMNK